MTYENDLSLFGSPQQNPYEEYFLLENPFPGYGDEPRKDGDVCTDQTSIKREFANILSNFGLEAKRLRINGESGAGKTNILYYFKRLTEEAFRQRRIKAIYPVFVSTPGDSYSVIHEQIVDKLTELFLDDLLIALQENPDLVNKLSAEIKSATEILHALKAIIKPRMQFALYEERQKVSFTRWLKGHKLPTSEKKLLENGISLSDINSAALQIRFLDGLLRVLKKIGKCEGIVLLFDEFEEIFEELGRAPQSRYAQDLRHLFDTLQELVFFVVATIPIPQDLGKYPAIERRLGENSQRLQPIESLELATEYVQDYLRVGRKQFVNAQLEVKERLDEEEINKLLQDINNLPPLSPLNLEQIKKEYEDLKAEAPERNILPGYYLPRIRHLMKEVVEGNSK